MHLPFERCGLVDARGAAVRQQAAKQKHANVGARRSSGKPYTDYSRNPRAYIHFSRRFNSYNESGIVARTKHTD